MLWLLTEWGGYRMKKRALRKENESVSVKDLTAILKNELNTELVFEQDDLFLYKIEYDTSFDNRLVNTLAAVLNFFETNFQSLFDFTLLIGEDKSRTSSPTGIFDRLKNRLFLFKEVNTLFFDETVSFPYSKFFTGVLSNGIFMVEKSENGWLLHGSLDSDFSAFNRDFENLIAGWHKSSEEDASLIEIYGGFPFLLRNWISNSLKEVYDIRITDCTTPFKRGRRKTLYLISVSGSEQAERVVHLIESEKFDRKREIPVILQPGTQPLRLSKPTLSLSAGFADPDRWERDEIRIFGIIATVKDFLEIEQISHLLKEVNEFSPEKIDFCVKTAFLFGFWSGNPEDKSDFLQLKKMINRGIFGKNEDFFHRVNNTIFNMFLSGEILYPESYAGYLLNQTDDSDRYSKILIIIEVLLRHLRIAEADMVLEMLSDAVSSMPEDSILEETLLLGQFYKARTTFDVPAIRLCGDKILQLPASCGNQKLDFEKKAVSAVFHFMSCRMEEAVNVAKDLLFRVNGISDSWTLYYKSVGNYLIAASMFGMQKLYEGSCYLKFIFDSEKSLETPSVYCIQAQLLRAASLYVSGQFHDLEKFFTQPHEIFTDSLFQNRFFYRFLQSRFYFDMGRYKQAEKILSDLIKECSTQKTISTESIAVLQAWIGRIYIYSNRKEDAKQCFSDLPVETADSLFFQAEGALFERQFDEAKQFLIAAMKNLKPIQALPVALITLKNFSSGFEIEDHFYFFNLRKPFLSCYIDFLNGLLKAVEGEAGALLKFSKFIRVQFIQKPEPNFIFFLYTNASALRFLADNHGDEINKETLSAKIQLLFYEKKFFTSKTPICEEFLKNNYWTRFFTIEGNKFQ